MYGLVLGVVLVFSVCATEEGKTSAKGESHALYWKRNTRIMTRYTVYNVRSVQNSAIKVTL